MAEDTQTLTSEGILTQVRKRQERPTLSVQGARLPPNATEIEELVLGALLIEPTLIGELREYLMPAHFYDPKNAEIYEVMLDTDSMRIVHRDEDSTLAKPELTHSYSRDTRTIANRYIHPDDRESFLELFSPENVSRKVADDPRLSTEYRVLAVDGTYHWISILVLPMPGSSRTAATIPT